MFAALASRRSSSKRLLAGALTVVCLLAGVASLSAAEPGAVTFKKIRLTDKFRAEGAGIGDFNRDGTMDVVYGPHWYAGPDYTTPHEIYPPEDFPPEKYSNNFITFVHDVNGDTWPDVLANVWPGKEVAWFQNPGAAGGAWRRHLAFPKVDNESPGMADVTGDGKPELVFHTEGVLGFAGPSDPTGTARWVFKGCSEPHKWGQYTHGLGVGDINGDGRADLVMSEGWWEQPADAQALWTKHPDRFGKQGAQIHVYDVDGDGDSDVIASIAAHGYGLSWFEQVKKDGATSFTEHPILPATPDAALDGVQFSQPHATELADVNGDGLADIVTGKRYWAHGPKGDADPGGKPVLYWFELSRKPTADGKSPVTYTPRLIDDDSGVGTQFKTGDLNGDRKLDVVIGNKKGGFVFIQK